MAVSEAVMTKAVLLAIGHWADKDLHAHRGGKKPIDFRWFNNFINNWRVARLLASKTGPNGEKLSEEDGIKIKMKALQLINNRFIVEQKKHLTPEGVDLLDLNLKKSKLTSLGPKKNDGSRNHRLCTSLVSKVAFHIQPEKFAPWDEYAIKGLRKRTSKKFGNYAEFMRAWNQEYSKEEQIIRTNCTDKRWAFIAEPLGVSQNKMKSTAFRRKVFDNILNFENANFTRQFVAWS